MIQRAQKRPTVQSRGAEIDQTFPCFVRLSRQGACFNLSGPTHDLADNKLSHTTVYHCGDVVDAH
ncbi:protein of unknown function [Candidatus Filomicrobium marinum]|nr:protein of unknown function [Candidatus Filomicrobium marinum]